MFWTSLLACNLDGDAAVATCLTRIQPDLGRRGRPDVGFLFVSTAFEAKAEGMIERLKAETGVRLLVGCSAGGVIGNGEEVEASAAISLVLGWLPGTDLISFSLTDSNLPDLDSPPTAWQERLGVPPGGFPGMVVLADPFTIRSDDLIAGLDYAYPDAIKVGGLASGGQRPGENFLVHDGVLLREGAVGVAFSDAVELSTIVAQGCRPIGRPVTVTDCRDYFLLELDNRPAFSILEEICGSLSPHDQALVRGSLFLGISMNSATETPGPGSFLVRNVMGVDPVQGVVAVGARLRPGQVVQFHLRDAETSSSDLAEMLELFRLEGMGEPASGALLFSCLGRGLHLYGRTNHDSNLFHRTLGAVPMGGFFCNGEIGPVGETTYLHGYTSCFGIFRPAQGHRIP